MSAITAPAIAVKATFSGATASGAISVPGLQTGDVIVAGTFTGGTTTTPSDWSPFSSGYEKVITVADEIQQMTSGDWSSLTFTLYLLRGV